MTDVRRILREAMFRTEIAFELVLMALVAIATAMLVSRAWAWSSGFQILFALRHVDIAGLFATPEMVLGVASTLGVALLRAVGSVVCAAVAAALGVSLVQGAWLLARRMLLPRC